MGRMCCVSGCIALAASKSLRCAIHRAVTLKACAFDDCAVLVAPWQEHCPRHSRHGITTAQEAEADSWRRIIMK